MIEGLEVFKDFLVISERSNGLKKLKLYPFESREEKYIEFDEETYRLNMGANFEYNTNDLYYSYSSLTTPSSVFRYNMLSGEKSCGIRKKYWTLLFLQKIMSQKGFGLEQMTVQRFPYRLSIKKERSLRGSLPALCLWIVWIYHSRLF